MSGFADKVKGVFGVRSLSEEIASESPATREETMDMPGYVHCGDTSNSNAVTTGKSTVLIQNQRRRLSKKSESIDSDYSIIAQSEDDVVTFGAEDTVFIVKGGLIEGEVTVKEIAEAISDCTRKDNANETAELFAKLGYGRRRSSVLRDRELEAAAAALGDRII